MPKSKLHDFIEVTHGVLSIADEIKIYPKVYPMLDEPDLATTMQMIERFGGGLDKVVSLHPES